MKNMASTTAVRLDAHGREARRLRRRIKDGRRFINIAHWKRGERTLRHERALEYLLSPGDPALYHDQEAIREALRAIADAKK